MTIAGTLQEDLTNIKASEFSFIDINTEKPLVVIGNQVFTGEFQVGDFVLDKNNQTKTDCY